MNGSIVGNVLLGGVIGKLVDASNGAVYSLDQEEIAVQLWKAGQAPQVSSNRVCIVVAINHPSGHGKIAILQGS
jgi:hypothetical protein